MKERPILFSAPMVRALLAGTKTQTRRAVKPQPREDKSITSGRGELAWQTSVGHFIVSTLPTAPKLFVERCPYGQPGDRLWVRETFAIVPRTAYRCSEGVQQVLRPDDDHDAAIFREGWDRSRSGFRWRPSIHMPRWASRITLEIVSVRVERLQEISEADAMAEGVGIQCESPMAIMEYSLLWESINGPGSWDANPWVWVVEFSRMT